jgi:hypothetical protein
VRLLLARRRWTGAPQLPRERTTVIREAHPYAMYGELANEVGVYGLIESL